MNADRDNSEQPVRWPFDPPYTADDLPQLDRQHRIIGLGAEWEASSRRAEIAATRLADAGTPPSAPEPSQAATEAHGDDERVAELLAENARLTHLLGSHADGHRCTCTMTDPGVYFGSNMHPPEWEQNPWCPTHPNVDHIRDDLLALADDWESKADAGEEEGYAAAARAVRHDAKELRAALDGDA